MILAFAAAPAVAGLPEAEACLKVQTKQAGDQGWRLRSFRSDDQPLRDGKVKTEWLLLYAGIRYRFEACADAGAKNLDLLLYDHQRTVVARDSTRDAKPSLEFTPDKSGTYYLSVYLQGPRERGASASIAYSISYQ